MYDAPRPAPSLATAMRPPCSAIRSRRNGKTQPEAAVFTGESRVLLSKAVEHVRQKSGVDPASGVTDDDLCVRAGERHSYPYLTSLRRELHGVRQQIPEDLLQAIRITGEEVRRHARHAP